MRSEETLGEDWDRKWWGEDVEDLIRSKIVKEKLDWLRA